jgi:hypothetical protein
LALLFCVPWSRHFFLLDLDQLRVPPAVRRFTSRQRRTEMLDAIMLAAGVAFFALSIAYVAACDKI